MRHIVGGVGRRSGVRFSIVPEEGQGDRGVGDTDRPVEMEGL